MNKLRNILLWFWGNKERMILVAALVVFCYAVALIVNPPEPPEVKLSPPPRPLDAASAASNDVVDRPPPPPPPSLQARDYGTFVEENPWTVYGKPLVGDRGGSTRAGAGAGATVTAGGFRTQLNRPQAQLSLPGQRPRWLGVDDTIGNYRVASIDVAGAVARLVNTRTNEEIEVRGQ